jgi:uncharacterized protein YchJ
MMTWRQTPLIAAIALASLGAADAFVGSSLPAAAAGRRAALAIAPRAGAARRGGLSLSMATKPESTKACACGSGMTYGECCQPAHKDNLPPKDPVALIRARRAPPQRALMPTCTRAACLAHGVCARLRASIGALVPGAAEEAGGRGAERGGWMRRYSAYAYQLPEFLMRTTEEGSPEFSRNTEKWEKELVEFCQSYKFENANGGVLGVGIEECSYVGKTDRAFVQFNARMIGRGQKLVEFWERSRVQRKDGRWYYSKGSLLEYEGPLY